MAPQRNKSSKQEEGQWSKQPKNSPKLNQAGNIKDDSTPAKDKSPDDLEI